MNQFPRRNFFVISLFCLAIITLKQNDFFHLINSIDNVFTLKQIIATNSCGPQEEPISLKNDNIETNLYIHGVAKYYARNYVSSNKVLLDSVSNDSFRLTTEYFLGEINYFLASPETSLVHYAHLLPVVERSRYKTFDIEEKYQKEQIHVLVKRVRSCLNSKDLACVENSLGLMEEKTKSDIWPLLLLQYEFANLINDMDSKNDIHQKLKQVQWYADIRLFPYVTPSIEQVVNDNIWTQDFVDQLLGLLIWQADSREITPELIEVLEESFDGLIIDNLRFSQECNDSEIINNILVEENLMNNLIIQEDFLIEKIYEVTGLKMGSIRIGENLIENSTFDNDFQSGFWYWDQWPLEQSETYGEFVGGVDLSTGSYPPSLRISSLWHELEGKAGFWYFLKSDATRIKLDPGKCYLFSFDYRTRILPSFDPGKAYVYTKDVFFNEDSLDLPMTEGKWYSIISIDCLSIHKTEPIEASPLFVNQFFGDMWIDNVQLRQIDMPQIINTQSWIIEK